MALPQTANANDITNVISNLAQRQGAKPKEKIPGPKRAAMLMLALGEQYGGKVWSLLDDDEVRELSIVMSTLGTVEADTVENMLLEFVSRMSASGALMGNFDATERLLQQYLPPERVSGIMDEIRGPAGRNMWEKLSNVQEEVLANYLKNEYPQTIAVVLSKLKPEHAARVLAILPEKMALDVVGRMLKMEAVQKEVIERVEQTLRVEFMSTCPLARRRRSAGAACQPRQGSRGEGRNHPHQEPRRRRAGVLMAAPAKFLFDTDFSAPDRSREKAATAAEIAQKVAAAEARAYRDGFDAGQREAKAESDRRTALALEEIKIALQGIAARFAGIETRMETEAVDVAIAVARKLCSELIAAEPLGEIIGLIKDCFAHLVSTPHLVVRINASLYEIARDQIERLAKQSGFEGRLVILAEPEIATGDCRIEWADGGVVLERAAIDEKINELVGRYIASRKGN